MGSSGAAAAVGTATEVLAVRFFLLAAVTASAPGPRLRPSPGGSAVVFSIEKKSSIIFLYAEGVPTADTASFFCGFFK